jgi:hypothetical protein
MPALPVNISWYDRRGLPPRNKVNCSCVSTGSVSTQDHHSPVSYWIRDPFGCVEREVNELTLARTQYAEIDTIVVVDQSAGTVHVTMFRPKTENALVRSSTPLNAVHDEPL